MTASPRGDGLQGDGLQGDGPRDDGPRNGRPGGDGPRDPQPRDEEHALATAAGGVRVVELFEIGDFEDVFRLFDDIWRPDPASAPISVEMMRALSHAGNYVAGAYDGDRLVGASVAFLGAPPGQVLHSHVTGASIGRGI
ncbi:hypothetical protein ACFSIL_30360, partial [Streptosporangium lutulentum]